MTDKAYIRMWATLLADIESGMEEAIKTKEEMAKFYKDAFDRVRKNENDILALSDEIYAQTSYARSNGALETLTWLRDRMEEIKEEEKRNDG